MLNVAGSQVVCRNSQINQGTGLEARSAQNLLPKTRPATPPLLRLLPKTEVFPFKLLAHVFRKRDLNALPRGEATVSLPGVLARNQLDCGHLSSGWIEGLASNVPVRIDVVGVDDD